VILRLPSAGQSITLVDTGAVIVGSINQTR
jgi:hypothetical protein